MIDLTYLEETAWEKQYLSEIFQLIPDIKAVAFHWRSLRLFRRRLPAFIPKYRFDRLRLPRVVDEDTVAIMLSDEVYRVPKRIRCLALFKQYVSEKDKRSIPFPLGFRRNFPSATPVPIEQRKIDVGFVGRPYPHRRQFLAAISNHPRLRNFRLELTCDKRLTVPQYTDFINDTKVSLCLPGNYSMETFRFYESLAIGCIAVSPKLPGNGLYKSHPGFEVEKINDADAVAEVLESILAAPAEHNSLQERSLHVWNSEYSPAAVAAMISQVVQSRTAGVPFRSANEVGRDAASGEAPENMASPGKIPR